MKHTVDTNRIVIFLVLGFAGVSMEARAAELTLRSSFEEDMTPLTTERVWTVDPDLTNPHRARWALRRDLNLQPSGLEFKVRALVRASGYSDLATFDCGGKIDPRFATLEGTKKAALHAALLWKSKVEEGRTSLAILLARATDDRERDLAFERWRARVDREWRAEVDESARRIEWDFYRQSARDAGVCKTPHSARTIPQWESIMEQPQFSEAPKLVARAPAKRWDTFYSVRMMLKVGQIWVSGKFLVDFSSRQSLASPTWLSGQGARADLMRIPDAQPVRVEWARRHELESTVGTPLHMTAVDFSGYALPLNTFVSIATDLFGPPAFAGSCCDGVLGREILHYFAVEVDPRLKEVKLWRREGFAMDPAQGWTWQELSSESPLIQSEGIRTRTVFDLPHGRYWTQKSASQSPSNHRAKASGLRLNYTFEEGNRVLKVIEIKAKSPASSLAQAGLKRGMNILQLEGKNAEELDQADVEDILGGVDGNRVKLSWRVGKALKTESIQIKSP